MLYLPGGKLQAPIGHSGSSVGVEPCDPICAVDGLALSHPDEPSIEVHLFPLQEPNIGITQGGVEGEDDRRIERARTAGLASVQ
jgi:hypothetical protein